MTKDLKRSESTMTPVAKVSSSTTVSARRDAEAHVAAKREVFHARPAACVDLTKAVIAATKDTISINVFSNVCVVTCYYLQYMHSRGSPS
jgi:ElaB/YqjD/DUF883 family membrane-anchored ribosome-binding protein